MYGRLTHFASLGTNWTKWTNWPWVTFQTLGNKSAQYNVVYSFSVKTLKHVLKNSTTAVPVCG